MKKLSNAQAFAKAIAYNSSAWKESKNAIQDAFFKGTAPAVEGIVKRRPPLDANRGVAFAISQIAQNIIKTAANGQNIEKVRTILSGVNALSAFRNSTVRW